jgi:integrase
MAMPAKDRFKTKYPGVYYIESSTGRNGKPERVYYIMYRKDGKLIEEKAGRQYADDMTSAGAAGVRTRRMQGKELSNKERREVKKAKEEAEKGRWTIDRLWREYKSQRPDSTSLRTDEGRYQNYIKPTFGSKEPRALIQLDVDRLRVNLLKKRKPQTVKHVLALLKRIVNFGVNKGLCDGIGFKIEMPAVHNLRTEDLTAEQLSRLLEAIDQDYDVQAANLMRMALFTGMRRGELFKLRYDDVDFERGFIRIRDPKGGPDQTIPLNEAARQLLETHPRSDSPYIFPGRYGGQRTDIKKAVNRIKKRAGLPKDFRALHGLRHVYASMLASSGKVDMYTLQKLLTHKSPQMTQRYAHLRDDTLRRAADLAGELIQEAVNSKSEEHSIKLEDR